MQRAPLLSAPQRVCSQGKQRGAREVRLLCPLKQGQYATNWRPRPALSPAPLGFRSSGGGAAIVMPPSERRQLISAPSSSPALVSGVTSDSGLSLPYASPLRLGKINEAHQCRQAAARRAQVISARSRRKSDAGHAHAHRRAHLGLPVSAGEGRKEQTLCSLISKASSFARHLPVCLCRARIQD